MSALHRRTRMTARLSLVLACFIENKDDGKAPAASTNKDDGKGSRWLPLLVGSTPFLSTDVFPRVSTTSSPNAGLSEKL